MPIDRNAPIPLHVQVASLIKDKISEGCYAPGTLLPSEREMCDEYEVSRTTIREMLRQLEREGLIYKVARGGIFVTEHANDLAVKVSLDGYTSDVKRQGGNPSSHLLDAGLMSEPSPEILKKMRLREENEVFRVVRLRFNNNVPMALHTVYLNARYCPNILDYNLSQDSLVNLFTTVYRLKLVRAEKYVYASLADQQELKLLSLSYPSPILRSQRLTYLENGDVIEFSLASYCGDSYKIEVNLDAQESLREDFTA